MAQAESGSPRGWRAVFNAGQWDVRLSGSDRRRGNALIRDRSKDDGAEYGDVDAHWQYSEHRNSHCAPLGCRDWSRAQENRERGGVDCHLKRPLRLRISTARFRKYSPAKWSEKNWCARSNSVPPSPSMSWNICSESIAQPMMRWQWRPG